MQCNPSEGVQLAQIDTCARGESPSPQPSPRKRGEGEVIEAAAD
jgi:hypothetical protein